MNLDLRKKLLTFFLVFGITLQLFSPVSWALSLASSMEPTPNQDMLNAMLYGDRSWVINTLVNDDRTGNPIAVLRKTDLQKSMARDALDTYRGIDVNSESYQAVYRKMVDVMNVYYNSQEYINDLINKLIDEAGELLSWVVGLFASADDARKVVDELTVSREELHYDSLLKSIFTESYTASDGTTLQDTEGSLLLVRQAQKATQYFKALNDFAKSDVSGIIGAENTDLFTTEYLDEYALPYADAARDYLESIGTLLSDDSGSEKAIIQIAADAAALAKYSSLAPEPDFMGFSYSDYLAENLVDNHIKTFLNVHGSVLDYADTSMDTYLYIDNIQRQKEAIEGPLSRLADIFQANGNTDMRASILHFQTLMSEEYDNQLLNWDSIREYLRSNQDITKYISKKVLKSAKTMLHLTDSYMLGAVAAKATTLTSVTSWISDRAVGLKDTCKKTYELLYWETLANYCADLYRSDVAGYQESPDEESAQAVLDDLRFLQRVRLYGEKIAYGIAAAQLDSWVGELYGGEDAKDAYDTIYQQNVDILMAATVMPPITGITVDKGKTLNIFYRDDVGFYGQSGSVDYVELSRRLAGGITVSGTLNIVNSSGKPLNICFVELNGGSQLNLSGNITVSELYQNDGQVALHVVDGGTLTVTDRLVLKDASYSSAAGEPVSTGELELNGTTDLTVVASGDVTGSGTLNTLVMSGDSQLLNGTLTMEKLQLTGKAVSVSGRTTVTRRLCGPATTVKGGENILFTGSELESGSFNGSLSVQNASISNVRITGSLFDKGGTAYAGQVTIMGGLECQGSLTTGNGTVISVQGPARFEKSVQGSGKLRLSGDLSTGENVVLPEVTLEGSFPQDVSGTFTASRLRFSNTSQKGVSVLGEVTVTELLDSQKGEVSVTSPVILSDSAIFQGDFPGSISVKNGTMPSKASIGGDLYVQDGGTLRADDLSVSGQLALAGACTIDGAQMTVGALSSPKSLSLQNGTAVTVLSAAELSGVLENVAELDVCGDLILNGLTTSGTIRCGGDVSVSGTTALGGLTLDGFVQQSIAGSPFKVVDLAIRNTSGRPVKLSQTITVTGRYDNTSSAVQGGSIRGALDETESIIGDTVISSGLVLDTPLNVNGCTLQIDGSLSAPDITLTNAKLIVNGDLTVTGSGSMTVDGGSQVTVNGALYTASGGITLNGALDVRSDLLADGPVSGGALTLGGDLYGSGRVTPLTLTLNGLVRQRVGASDVHAGSVLMRNTSKGGILFERSIYYSGSLDPGDTPVFGNGELIKEAE